MSIHLVWGRGLHVRGWGFDLTQAPHSLAASYDQKPYPLDGSEGWFVLMPLAPRLTIADNLR